MMQSIANKTALAADFWQQKFSPSSLHWTVITIGDLTLYIRLDGAEYLLAWQYQDNGLATFSGNISTSETLPENVTISERCAINDKAKGSTQLQLQPKLADKPYQVKAFEVIKLPAKTRITLFVGTPIWLSLIDANDNLPLLELPVVRPMKSWVGRSPIDGTICYTSRTHAPSNPQYLVEHNHKVLTALELSNDGEKTVSIDRLSLPIPFLSVFAVASGSLWSESVRFRLNDSDIAVVTGVRPLKELGEATLLSPARHSHQRGGIKAVLNLVME